MSELGNQTTLPRWLEVLNEEDRQFLKRFLLSSGSLKALAEEYQVSYPTLRARLDRLIAKVNAVNDPQIVDPFHQTVRLLVAEARLSPSLARELLDAYRASVMVGKNS